MNLTRPRTGAVRPLTSPRPADWPATLLPRTDLHWAVNPHWSPDSRYVYFQSNRTPPHDVAWWRVPVAGGPEEPVTGPVLLADELAWSGPAFGALARRLEADGFLLRSLSPDRRWAAADQPDSNRFRLYPLDHPEGFITYLGVAGPGGRFAWSPDSRRTLVGGKVLELGEGGTARLVAFPDPLAGVPVAEGFVGNHRLLVSLRPWNDEYDGVRWPAEAQWWLLDLTEAPPIQPQEPTRIVSAGFVLGSAWRQTGQVTGGEADLVGKEGVLSLLFDRPVSPEWLREHVQIDGAGAQLETERALRGLGTVRVGPGRPGEEFRIRVPSFGFDLRVRRQGP